MIFAAKNLLADRVNLIQNDYAAGLPSPLAFLGLADCLVRELGLTPWSARVLPVLHEVTASEGRMKPEMEKSGARFATIETIEGMHGRVRASLLIDLPGCEDETAVARALAGKRIAGGPIAGRHIDIRPVGAADGGVFPMLRRGYAMVRPDPASRPEGADNEPPIAGRLGVSRGDEAGLARVAQELFPAEKIKGSGWVVPCAAGYRLIEDPARVPERAGVRTPEVPHVFAEPLVGIAELISVRNARMRDADADVLDDLCWRWSARDDLILAHPSYHLH